MVIVDNTMLRLSVINYCGISIRFSQLSFDIIVIPKKQIGKQNFNICAIKIRKDCLIKLAEDVLENVLS